MRRADHEAGLRQSCAGSAVESPRDAEVDEQRPAARRVEHDVVGLDVAMDQTRFVRVVERIEDRDDDRERALGRQRTGALEQLPQRHAVHERHRVVDEPFAFAHKVDRQDVGVLEPRSRSGLALEALDHPGGPGDVGAEDLHGQPTL